MTVETLSDGVQIIHADCYDLLDGWPSNAALITDPPYGIGFVHGRNRWKGIVGDNAPFDPRPFLRFRTICLWGANYFADSLPPSSGWLVWDKRVKAESNKQSDCELAWTNQAKAARMYRYLWNGAYGRRPSEHGVHPFLKPIALMAWCLEYCEVGKDQLVIDPFMGSGTIGIACHRAGIPYLGVEIDSAYYQVAKERLLAEVSQGMLPLSVAS